MHFLLFNYLIQIIEYGRKIEEILYKIFFFDFSCEETRFFKLKISSFFVFVVVKVDEWQREQINAARNTNRNQ